MSIIINHFSYLLVLLFQFQEKTSETWRLSEKSSQEILSKEDKEVRIWRLDFLNQFFLFKTFYVYNFLEDQSDSSSGEEEVPDITNQEFRDENKKWLTPKQGKKGGKSKPSEDLLENSDSDDDDIVSDKQTIDK